MILALGTIRFLMCLVGSKGAAAVDACPASPATALTSGRRVWTCRAGTWATRIALGDRGGQLLALGDVGTLHLDPATLTSVSMGSVSRSGVATYTTTAGLVSGMIGRTLWFQGFTSGPRRLTTDFVQLTILP